MLNIAIVNDIHNGPDTGTKKGTLAPELLQKFVAYVNTNKPDITLDLGDRVNHVSRSADRRSLTCVSNIFKELHSPRVHLLGNHDVDYLTIQDNEEILGCSFASWYEIKNGFSLVYWNADVHMDKTLGMTLRESDIAWLEETLQHSTYPTIIFTHVPLNNGSMIGNFYFDTYVPKKAQYPTEQGQKVREIIERSDRVIACINGHAHWNAYGCIDGIHYVTLPSLTETFMTYPHPASAWSWLRFNKKTIEIEISGLSPMKYTLPVREASRHWVNMMKDYSPVQITPK